MNVKGDLSAIFDFAVKRGLVESNPVPGLRGLVRIPRSESKAALTLENGHPPDAIERQLAHVESNRVRATYNKALMVEERRQIMQVWGDYLAMAEAENVIPLRVSVARAG